MDSSDFIELQLHQHKSMHAVFFVANSVDASGRIAALPS